MPLQQDDEVNQQQPWLSNLKKNLEQFENSTLEIEVGSTKVYEQVGNEVTVNQLQGDAAIKVHLALSDPHKLKDSVRIILDGEKVFHAKQGEVLENNLPLTPIPQVQSATAAQDDDRNKVQAVNQDLSTPTSIFNTRPGLYLSHNSQSVEASLDHPPNLAEQRIELDPQSDIATASVLEQPQPETELLEPEALEAEIQVENQLEEQASAAIVTDEVEQAQPGTFDVQFELLPAVASETKSKPELTPPTWNDVRNLIASSQTQPSWADAAIFTLLTHQSQQINELQQKVDSLQKLKPPLNAQVAQLFRSVRDVAANSIQEVKERAQQLPQDIQQFLGDKVSQVQQAVARLFGTTKDVLSNKTNQVQQAVVERVDTAKNAISGKVSQVKDSVDQRLADVSASALDTASRWLVNKFGKDIDGTGDKAWKGKDYTFTVSGEHTSISNKDGHCIALNGNFTSAASAQDAGKLAKLPQDVQQAVQKLQSQQKQVAGGGLKR